MPEARVRSRPRRPSLPALACLALAIAPGVARSQAPARVPAQAEAVLRAIDETGQAPAGVVGGRAYQNQARRGEQPLPRVDREGDPIAYRTWDVHPEVPGRGRGAERLVTGSDGSAYYTPDDYKTFRPIRNPSRSSLAGAVHAKPPEEASRPMPPASKPNRNAPARPADKPVVALDPQTAARVMPVVDHVLKDGEPLPDHVGGRDYRNLGLDDGETLPRADAQGRPIRYREWDVNRRVPGRNRGAERIITGSDGRAYYTRDHYLTFQRVR